MTRRLFHFYLVVVTVFVWHLAFSVSATVQSAGTLPNVSIATPFPLGVYVGQPDNSSTTNQASFLTQASSFETATNATPIFFDTYTNYSDPISHWAAQNGWQAASWASTPQLASASPVIGLPLTSLQDKADTDYRAFAAGQYDAMLQQLVQIWVQAGYRTQYWRLGWEMNLYGNPQYGGDMGTQEQADWITAFQHVYSVMHAAGLQYGANVQIIWNPGFTSYSPAGSAITQFYPGNNYVDIIGLDIYADLYPFSLYDFSTGQVDSSLAQWASNPVNLQHYYNYPAGNQWSNDASTGHSTTLLDIIAFAQTAKKPLAIVETGAGNSSNSLDINDNPIFPKWLAQVLGTALASSVNIAFVNIWDVNAGGNYEFSYTSDNKPLEKAAWALYFGGERSCGATASGSTVTVQVSQTSGSVAATTAQCPYGGTQATETTVTQVEICTNGTLTAQGAPVSTTVNSGKAVCNASRDTCRGVPVGQHCNRLRNNSSGVDDVIVVTINTLYAWPVDETAAWNTAAWSGSSCATGYTLSAPADYGKAYSDSEAVATCAGAAYWAALTCYNHGTTHTAGDWFLPGNNVMYNMLYENNVGSLSFPSTYYWSSTEYNAAYAWAPYFGNGLADYYFPKSNTSAIRCVRQ